MLKIPWFGNVILKSYTSINYIQKSARAKKYITINIMESELCTSSRVALCHCSEIALRLHDSENRDHLVLPVC